MSQRTDSLEVGALRLSSGEGRRLELDVSVDPFDFGGQRYAVPGDEVAVTLDVSHTTTGHALRLRFDTQLEGPCMRCLEPGGHAVAVDAREIDQPGGGEELSSPYLEDDQLDLRSWARDALALALPTQIVCREDCRASYEELKGRGVEFTETPEERPYGVDCGFRDPSGNSIRLTQVNERVA